MPLSKALLFRLLPHFAVTLHWFSAALHAAPGDLDSSFGIGGKVTTPFLRYGNGFTWTNARASSVVVLPDGKIVLGGYADTNVDDFALARYLSDGSLDLSFNGTGKVTTDFTPGDYSHEQASGMALQADGKILLAGYTVLNNKSVFALARYTSGGTLDTSFNGTGRVITVFDGPSGATCLATQSDGKIVVCGYTSSGRDGNSRVFAVLRYNDNGTLDTSFNGTGMVTTALGGSYDVPRSAVLQSDGKIVVAGESTNPDGNGVFAIARYSCNGTLDTSFNGTGKIRTAVNATSHSQGRSVAIQGDGKIVIAGNSYDASGNGSFALIRYTAAGALDTSFNTTGIVNTPVGSTAMGQGLGMVIQANGKIVVAGTAGKGPNFGLARYHPTGSLDTTFNGTGIVVTDVGSLDEAFAVALQSDGKIVAAGYSGFQGIQGPQYNFAVARFVGDGPGPLATWRQQTFGITNNVGKAADLATPDQDGIPNLVKYALRLTPGSTSSVALPPARSISYAEGERLALNFTRDPSRSDVTLSVQAADSPAGPWTTVATSTNGAAFTGAGFVSETLLAGGLMSVEVRDTVNATAAARRFMRIQIAY
jgi:uncharacterized delta-60 repeat protein